MESSPSDPVRRALAEGAERSRAVARPDGSAPVVPAAADALAGRSAAAVVAVPTAPDVRRVELWRRHKWKIYGVLFLVLTELCLVLLGHSLAMGPG